MGFQEGRVAMFCYFFPNRIPMFSSLTPLFSICSLSSSMIHEKSVGVEEKLPYSLPSSSFFRKFAENSGNKGERGNGLLAGLVGVSSNSLTYKDLSALDGFICASCCLPFSSENGLGTKAERISEKGRVNP
jgi:hypothetical protein